MRHEREEMLLFQRAEAIINNYRLSSLCMVKKKNTQRTAKGLNPMPPKISDLRIYALYVMQRV